MSYKKGDRVILYYKGSYSEAYILYYVADDLWRLSTSGYSKYYAHDHEMVPYTDLAKDLYI